MNLRRFAVVGMIILGMLAIYAAMSQGGGALSGKEGEAGSNAPPEEITYSQLLTAIEQDRIVRRFGFFDPAAAMVDIGMIGVFVAARFIFQINIAETVRDLHGLVAERVLAANQRRQLAGLGVQFIFHRQLEAGGSRAFRPIFCHGGNPFGSKMTVSRDFRQGWQRTLGLSGRMSPRFERPPLWRGSTGAACRCGRSGMAGNGGEPKAAPRGLDVINVSNRKLRQACWLPIFTSSS